MQIIMVDPTQVIVREGLERYRQDLGDIEKLADSIERTRQILPIIITKQFELIDGGRRLAACLLKNIKVKAVFEDVVDDYEYRELEIEANLHRKDFSPAEEALAIRDLHNLKQGRLGTGGAGTTDGWTIGKTAELLGKTRGTVYNALEMASMIDIFPELKKSTKKSEIMKAGKALKKLSAAMESSSRHEQAVKDNKFFELHNVDAVDFMETVPDGYTDILLSDPLYGIGANLITKTIGGGVGKGFSTAGFKIEDEQEAAYFYYYVLAKQSFRFCTDSAHGYVFVGPEHFWKIREIFQSAGWRVHVKPLIWIKRSTGQCNIPSSWPASCYEMLMYIRKDNSRLIKEGCPDWVECNPVLPSERRHPYEKPVELLTELLERVSLPGQRMIDPFMGSASSLEAGLKMKLYCIGCEIDKSAYSLALERMSDICNTLTRKGEIK